MVGRYVDGVGGGVVFHGQAQVGNDRRAVLLHQDVFRLKVSVSNAGFAFKQTQQMRKLTPDRWKSPRMQGRNIVSNFKIESVFCIVAKPK